MFKLGRILVTVVVTVPLVLEVLVLATIVFLDETVQMMVYSFIVQRIVIFTSEQAEALVILLQ